MLQNLLDRVLKMMFQNFGYKLLSLFLAIIVWAIIQGEQIQEINREVYVNIHVPPSMGIRGEMVRLKAVTLRGPQAWLLEVPQKLSADVFVPPGKLGSLRFRLSKDDVKNLNERLDLVVHEPYIELFVDKLIERTIPIKETLLGTPAEGFSIEKVSVEPRSIVVRGIRADLVNIRSIYTEPIDVTSFQESRSVDARLLSPGLGADALSVETVRVNFQLGTSKINKRIGMVPIEVQGSNAHVKISPEFATILVQGPSSLVNNLKKSDFRAYVDVSGLGFGRHEQDIRVKIPPETALIETFPEKAMVTLER